MLLNSLPAAEEVPPAGLRQLLQRDRLAPELGPIPDPRHVAPGLDVDLGSVPLSISGPRYA